MSDSDVDLEAEFEKRMQEANGDGELYDVSDFGESYVDDNDDDMQSQFSYKTLNSMGPRSKNFIPEGADLDQIVDTLIHKKTKHLERL
jgi:hypothetical protein